eukprot:247780_1
MIAVFLSLLVASVVSATTTEAPTADVCFENGDSALTYGFVANGAPYCFDGAVQWEGEWNFPEGGYTTTTVAPTTSTPSFVAGFIVQHDGNTVAYCDTDGVITDCSAGEWYFLQDDGSYAADSTALFEDCSCAPDICLNGISSDEYVEE